LSAGVVKVWPSFFTRRHALVIELSPLAHMNTPLRHVTLPAHNTITLPRHCRHLDNNRHNMATAYATAAPDAAVQHCYATSVILPLPPLVMNSDTPPPPPWLPISRHAMKAERLR